MDINAQSATHKLLEEAMASVAPDKDLEGTITVKDRVYKIKKMDADDGLNLWEYILQRLLPSIGTGLDVMQGENDPFQAATTFSEAMMHLSNKLDGNSFKLISHAVLEGAEVNGEPMNFKEEFAGNYGAWRKVLAFALQENFKSFFEEGWATGLKDLMAMVSPQFQSSQPE